MTWRDEFLDQIAAAIPCGYQRQGSPATEPMREDNALAAGSDIRVGVEAAERADGVRHWQIAGPFSDGYLLATVSEEPLYEGVRPIEESISEYREVLLQSLADPGTGRKAARVERLEFRPRS